MIPLFRARIPEGALTALASVLATTYIGRTGPLRGVERFEDGLREFLGVRHVVATSSCTTALTVALRLAGVRPGSHVVASPMTFIATPAAIVAAGGVPIWADVDGPTSCQISARSVDELPRAAAILAVAWGGEYPALDALRECSRDAIVPLILDAAQAIGATFRGSSPIVWADYVCYSFGPTKQLSTPSMGALVCRTADDEARARRLIRFGLGDDGRADEIGERGYPDELTAALACAGLPGLPAALARARENAVLYRERFLEHSHGGSLHREAYQVPSPYFYTLFVDDPVAFMAHMARAGVEAGRPHRRCDEYGFVASSSAGRSLPNVDQAVSSYVALPVGWWVSERDRMAVVDGVRTYRGRIL